MQPKNPLGQPVFNGHVMPVLDFIRLVQKIFMNVSILFDFWGNHKQMLQTRNSRTASRRPVGGATEK
jgi:hypothetical protein